MKYPSDRYAADMVNGKLVERIEPAPMTVAYAGAYRTQMLLAEAWFDRVTALAIKHGVMMVHDEILFESVEQMEAFNQEMRLL